MSTHNGKGLLHFSTLRRVERPSDIQDAGRSSKTLRKFCYYRDLRLHTANIRGDTQPHLTVHA